jgi:hypothetical protein
MPKRILWTFLLFFVASIGVPSRSVEGQAVTATLVGTVTDQTGAAVTHAPVSITNQGTRAAITATSNESGNYDFSFLPPGTYTITVTAPGFQQSVTTDVNVPVNTTTRVDVMLQAGSTSQTISVTDQAPLLQTDRADVSAQIEAKQVLELPVGNSQNFQELESLIPGVSAPIYDHSTFDNAQNSRTICNLRALTITRGPGSCRSIFPQPPRSRQ